MMEAQAKSYTITIEDLGGFDLDEDRSIAPSIEISLKQNGVTDAVVDQNEFNSSMVEVVTTATQDELERALQSDDLHAEVSMNEDNEEMVHSPAGHFKQDDFTPSVKAQKKFKYVPAKQGDNPMTNEKNEAVKEDRYNALMSEYKSFVAESDSKKKDLIISEAGQIAQILQRDYSSHVARTQKKIQTDFKASGIDEPFNIMAEPLFTKSAETVFRVGRRGGGEPGLKAIGGIEDVTQNLKDIQLGVSVAGFQPQMLKQLDPAIIQKRLQALPYGEPFSNMEGYIKTKADALKIVRIRNLYLNILSAMELASRLDPGKAKDIPGKVGGAFDRAAQAVGTSTGNYQSIVDQ